MCTVEKRGNIYILTLKGNKEHRLYPNLISSIKSSLHQIRSDFFTNSKPPSALITTSEGKFFSNGYDLNWANSTPNPTQSKLLMDSQLQTLISDLISLPMPTIAAVTGHASAAGLILAMAMSELDIGLVIPRWFMAVVRCKIGCLSARRAVVLTAEKVTGAFGRMIGVVDKVFEGVEATVAGAVRMAEEMVKRGWDGVVYGEIRKGLFKEVLDCIRQEDGGVRGGIRAKL